MPKVKRHNEVCYCGAYPFPHREGGGKCLGNSWPGGEYICESCRERATAKFIDTGIGPYEYWGAPGVDRRLEFLTTCCEVTPLDNSLSHNPASPPERDYDDDY